MQIHVTTHKSSKFYTHFTHILHAFYTREGAAIPLTGTGTLELELWNWNFARNTILIGKL